MQEHRPKGSDNNEQLSADKVAAKMIEKFSSDKKGLKEAELTKAIEERRANHGKQGGEQNGGENGKSKRVRFERDDCALVATGQGDRERAVSTMCANVHRQVALLEECSEFVHFRLTKLQIVGRGGQPPRILHPAIRWQINKLNAMTVNPRTGPKASQIKKLFEAHLWFASL